MAVRSLPLRLLPLRAMQQAVIASTGGHASFFPTFVSWRQVRGRTVVLAMLRLQPA